MNEKEQVKEPEKFRDFAHGSSQESIETIKAYGINDDARRNRSRGGRVNRPGFYPSGVRLRELLVT